MTDVGCVVVDEVALCVVLMMLELVIKSVAQENARLIRTTHNQADGFSLYRIVVSLRRSHGRILLIMAGSFLVCPISLNETSHQGHQKRCRVSVGRHTQLLLLLQEKTLSPSGESALPL